jgi:fibronectin type 3 domain-containing protein
MKLLLQTREQQFTRTRTQFLVNFCSVLILLATTLASSAQAQSVTLAWDPVNGVTGYKVYQGGASRAYSNSVDAGNSSQKTLSPLTAGKTYYFAVTAYNNSGVESDYSTEISYTVPMVSVPVIMLTSPTNGAAYSSPATIHLAANVTANGHTITKVQFLSNGSVVDEVSAAPYAFDLANVNSGAYSFAARVVYDGGLTLDTPAAAVTVTSGRPPPHHSRIFAADSGVLTVPFVAVGGIVSQSLLTTLVGSGEGVYTFTIDVPGNYTVSAMLNAPSDGENSLYVNVDGEPADPFMIWDIPVTSGFTNLTANWRGNGTPTSAQFSPKIFTLTAGDHQLYVRGREPNTQLQSFTIAPPGALLQASVLPNRSISLVGVGQPAHQYEVQATRDFRNWTVLGTATADSTGAFSFTDTSAPSYSNRSYRLRDKTP